MNRSFYKTLIFIALSALVGCAETKKEMSYIEKPVEQLYNLAIDQALTGNFKAAAPLFDEVERQHPYSTWATQAQLMAAYSLYQSNQYDEAVNALNRFIQLNPSNKNIDYAYYLKGLSYYERIVDVGRDQRITKQALDTFSEIVKRFPKSKFARDAKLKIDLTRNHLAGKEMEIGRFYLKRGHYFSAINRFKVVVGKFDTTAQVPEALHRLTEAYLALGLKEEATKTAAILGYNYPGSDWYRDTYSIVKTGKLSKSKLKDNGLFGLGFWVF
ncbi:MAG: outer membrane protein assembly factor BamD [Nisaea sp.]|nr:outer membrane protein assembly factor BamD [Nisaea sp.]